MPSTKMLNAAGELEFILKNFDLGGDMNKKINDIMQMLCFYSAMIDDNTYTTSNVIPFNGRKEK